MTNGLKIMKRGVIRFVSLAGIGLLSACGAGLDAPQFPQSQKVTAAPTSKPEIFSPDQLSSLYGWYKADYFSSLVPSGSALSTGSYAWLSQGTGNAFTQFIGSLVFSAVGGANSQPEVRYGSPSSQIYIPANSLPAAIGGMTIFVVLNQTTAGNAGIVEILGTGNSMLSLSSASALRKFEVVDSASSALSTSISSSATQITSGYHIHQARWTVGVAPAFDTLEYAVTHEGNSSTTANAVRGGTNLSTGKIILGGQSNSATGNYCELLIYTRPLDNEELQRVSDYLVAKYKL